ncbi:hypothetical protein V8V80_25085 [Niallia taxi]
MNDINIPAGRKRFIDSFPSKGADNQGITKINSAIDFGYLLILILKPPMQLIAVLISPENRLIIN